jgi:dCMP deaminase
MDLNNVRNINFHVGIPNLEEYYMMIAFVVSSRANCLSRAVGAVLVTSDNRHILATAYNGVPKGLPHCDVCKRRVKGFGPGEGLNLCEAAHAEQNILTQLARNNSGSSKDAILYVTDSPCSECTKLIINSDIKKVVYCREYPNPDAVDKLKASNIEVIKIDEQVVIEKIKHFASLLK